MSRTLRLMYDHAFLGKAPQPAVMGEGVKEFVYHLPVPRDLWKVSRKGKLLAVKRPATVVALQETLGLDQNQLCKHLKQRQYDGKRKRYGHALAVNQIRIHFVLGAQNQGWDVLQWIDDYTLHQKDNYDRVRIPKPTKGNPNRTDEIPLIPDGKAILGFKDARGNAHFTIEADHNSNLSIGRWGERVKGYMVWFSSGAYRARYHAKSLRALTVSPNQDRVARLKQATEQAAQQMGLPNLSRLFWFTTYRKAHWQALFTAPIWEVAGEQLPQALVSPPTSAEPTVQPVTSSPVRKSGRTQWTIHSNFVFYIQHNIT